jgi:hypothetical protein
MSAQLELRQEAELCSVQKAARLTKGSFEIAHVIWSLRCSWETWGKRFLSTSMSTDTKRVESAREELSMIEFENQQLLDDDSVRLIAEARRHNIITDSEWDRIKDFLKEALGFLRLPNRTVTRDENGELIIDPDFDPRNADWLRIDAAHRLSGRLLPMWAALWLWRLRTDTSIEFWHRIGRVADRLGYEPKR